LASAIAEIDITDGIQSIESRYNLADFLHLNRGAGPNTFELLHVIFDFAPEFGRHREAGSIAAARQEKVTDIFSARVAARIVRVN